MAKSTHGLLINLNGGPRPPLYRVWTGMRERCNNRFSPSYHRFGKLGIKICPEWDDFLAFQAWGLTNGHAPGLFLHRRDQSQDFSPDNCYFGNRIGHASLRKVEQNVKV